MTEKHDLLVIGAGAAGLAASLAAQALGLRVCVVGRLEAANNGRTVALLDGSLRFFRSLGLEQAIASLSSPLATMQIVDDTHSLFYVPPIAFRSSEIGLKAFGRNIENAALIRLLAEAVEQRDVRFEKTAPDAFHFSKEAVEVSLGDRRLSAPLAIAADGRLSPAREAAGIRTKTWRYGQSAVAAILGHDIAHDDVSTEFHTRAGPFTLVPMQDSATGLHRSSLVWMTRPEMARKLIGLSPEDFAHAAQRQAQSMLGRMSAIGERSLAAIVGMKSERLTGQRLALVGDAAHVFPPIGAQGLNLGLRDVACLAERLATATDPGADSILQAYERDRRADIDLRTLGVDLLNRSLVADLLPVDFARSLGLQAMARFGPLRRAAMRGGVGPLWRAPASIHDDFDETDDRLRRQNIGTRRQDAIRG